VTQRADTPERIEITSYAWPEVSTGTDLAGLVAASADVADGDVVVVTSKVVSKAEGRVTATTRADVVTEETARVVARRGPTVIAETRHGLVMAAAGVDASNVEPGLTVALPLDPDDSARRLRDHLFTSTGRNVAVVITDTSGRAWRNGQIDIAIGCAGLLAMVDLAGTPDTFGNVLAVTAPALADEVASAADLVKGKTTGRPLAVVRGLSSAVLDPGTHGTGASALVRAAADDLFGLGTREAVTTAVQRGDESALSHFPQRIASDPDPFEGLEGEHPDVRVTRSPRSQPPRRGDEDNDRPSADPSETTGWLVCVDIREQASSAGWMAAGAVGARIETLAAAHRLCATILDTSPAIPLASADSDQSQTSAWRTLTKTYWSVA
jgi:coenzyme F420-0:L-glutamate ligase/coenzyme F420-1:gamma-L-glutamate ligase